LLVVAGDNLSSIRSLTLCGVSARFRRNSRPYDVETLEAIKKCQCDHDRRERSLGSCSRKSPPSRKAPLDRYRTLLFCTRHYFAFHHLHRSGKQPISRGAIYSSGYTRANPSNSPDRRGTWFDIGGSKQNAGGSESALPDNHPSVRRLCPGLRRTRSDRNRVRNIFRFSPPAFCEMKGTAYFHGGVRTPLARFHGVVPFLDRFRRMFPHGVCSIHSRIALLAVQTMRRSKASDLISGTRANAYRSQPFYN